VLPDWARAHGEAVCDAVIRTTPGDFFVEEQLGFAADGDGEHDFLLIEKTGANTAWVARQLAHHARIPVKDVGYAGLKDRNAVTRQAFTVRRPAQAGTDWASFEAEGVEILDVARHGRKLRRGAHKNNRFRIVLRGADITSLRAELEIRLAVIADRGVPNYFGEQRFGHNGSNIALAREVLAGKRVNREQRSIAISAARSLLFNQVLDARVRAGNWDRIEPGDLANLDGTGSVFAVDELTADLEKRCAGFDIHPTATLWGRGAPLGAHEVARLESSIADSDPDLAAGLQQARVDASSRSLRLQARGLSFDFGAGCLLLRFSLARGGFATAVLRDLARLV
jgi:tRNA pseudouridine13 synthase